MFYLISEDKETAKFKTVKTFDDWKEAQTSRDTFERFDTSKHFYVSIYPPERLLSIIKREASKHAKVKACEWVQTKYFKTLVFNN